MKRILLAVAFLSAATCALAQVKVTDPWVRGTVPTQESSGAFMKLQSPNATRLVEGKSPVGQVEIHEMSMHGDVMRMKQIDGLDLPAGKTVELKPGGYHLMLTGLKNQLKEGNTVPVTLIFKNADGKQSSVELKIPVRALNASAAKPKGHHVAH